MKKWILIGLCIIFSDGLCHAKVTRLGLINPTPPNLQKILYLIDHHYIRLDSVKIIGIYHKDQTGLIESTREFIQKHGYIHISILTIQNTLFPDNLYTNNPCSEEFREVFSQIDGAIFLGGADISPALYGEKTFLTTELIPDERNWEISFLFHLTGGDQNREFVPLLEERPGFPILGVCLGMQQMNVAGGGTLYQDIPFQLFKKKSYEAVLEQDPEKQHKNYQGRIHNLKRSSVLHFHHIKIAPNSILDFGEKEHPLVASVHHQSVKKTGRNYRTIATSMDGKVVEAIAHTKYANVYGIQFHPEFSVLFEQSEFTNAKNEAVSLDDHDRTFHVHFWKNFSARFIDHEGL